MLKTCSSSSAGGGGGGGGGTGCTVKKWNSSLYINYTAAGDIIGVYIAVTCMQHDARMQYYNSDRA